MTDNPAATIRIVVETLRKLSTIVECEPDRFDMINVAGLLEITDWTAGMGYCPVCEETECDGDCPLRDVPRGWVGEDHG